MSTPAAPPELTPADLYLIIGQQQAELIRYRDAWLRAVQELARRNAGGTGA